MRYLLSVVLFCLFAVHAHAAIAEKAVEYQQGGVTLKGYLAYDDTIAGKRPGLLVVHEWWGHNDYVRKRARMLAELGYVALALDMYGEGKQAAHPDDAKAFSSEVMKNFDVAKARFTAALDFLKKQSQTDPERIAAIGYCFGGSVVLNMARQGADLKGVASFHGNLQPVKPAEPGSVKAKIMVFNGADDRFITPEQITAFEEEMKKAGADYTFISYPGAKHSFTNPDADSYAEKFNLALAYNADADKKSWQELTKFLERIFKKEAIAIFR